MTRPKLRGTFARERKKLIPRERLRKVEAKDSLTAIYQLGPSLILQLVFLELAVKRRAIHAQNPRGFRFVAASRFKNLVDVLSLDLVQSQLSGESLSDSNPAVPTRYEMSGKSATLITAFFPSRTACWTACSSSRILPGQSYVLSAAIASEFMPSTLRVVLSGKLLNEVIDQQRNIVSPFTQRRKRDSNHVQPIIKILPKFAGTHESSNPDCSQRSHGCRLFRLDWRPADGLLCPPARAAVWPVESKEFR